MVQRFISLSSNPSRRLRKVRKGLETLRSSVRSRFRLLQRYAREV